MMETFFLQQLVNGLTLGSVYGLIAIGYTIPCFPYLKEIVKYILTHPHPSCHE